LSARPVEQRLLDLFEEQALCANLGQRAVLHHVTRGDDESSFELDAG